MTKRVVLVGQWGAATVALKKGAKQLPHVVAMAIAQEALVFERAIKQHIQAGPPPPLKGGRRIKANGKRGGSKPLNNTGDLRNAVQTIQRGADAFIGIPRIARGHNGKSFSIAMVHEHGATVVIPLTDKVRRFLFGVLFKDEASTGGGGAGGRGFIVVRIPPRPFIRPAFEQEAPKSPERFAKRVGELLGGTFGP